MDAGTVSTAVATDAKAFRKAQLFAQNIVHLTSLLHAVALQHLRGDWELDNLIPFHSLDPPPPLVCSSLSMLSITWSCLWLTNCTMPQQLTRCTTACHARSGVSALGLYLLTCIWRFIQGPSSCYATPQQSLLAFNLNVQSNLCQVSRNIPQQYPHTLHPPPVCSCPKLCNNIR